MNQPCDVKLHQPVSLPCDVKLYQLEPVKEKLSAEAFEEEIRELNREIKKYDRKFTGPPGFGVGTGKENVVSQPCIYKPNVLCPTVHATQLSPSTHMPLAEIPSSLVHHMHAEGTWKRLTRIRVASNVGMVETVGEKRCVENTPNQIELPKKRRFPREVQQKIRYWRRLAISPARSNEFIIMELL